MNKDEKRKLMLTIEKTMLEYPAGLEKLFVVDEKALRLLTEDLSPQIDSNIEKYFNEQIEIKNTVKDLLEKTNKLYTDYQANCTKLIEYIKTLNL